MAPSKPAIVSVDDDPAVARAVQRDLRRRYADRYQVLSANSGGQALEIVDQLRRREQPVALLLADQRMPQMNGVDFLEQAMERVPDAKRALLTAYADTEAAIKAINDVQLDHYLRKPWDPPEDHLYPVLDDLLEEWQADERFRDTEDATKIVGHRFARESHELRDFLARNQVPTRWLDIERTPEAREVLVASGASEDQLPVVVLPGGQVLVQPSRREVAEAHDVSMAPKGEHYDLVIVGGGPAGLAGAVYGASEGLSTVLLEREAAGGQAGQSSRIENYLGFPVGLSGADLARRATQQAERLGAELVTAGVKALEVRGGTKVLTLKDDREVHADAVIIATGVAYRRLEAPGVLELEGAGIYYGAARTEAMECKDERVVVVGGANSAGQAAMELSKYAAEVHMLCRGADLADSMSHYLVEQIRGQGNITVHQRATVTAAHGEGRLRELTLDLAGEEVRKPIDSMFIFIGAHPHTDWADGVLARDRRGFLLTGPDVAVRRDGAPPWPLKRDPLPLETSVPGVFVAGDVRAASVKRVASAVGEGAMAVQLVHQYKDLG